MGRNMENQESKKTIREQFDIITKSNNEALKYFNDIFLKQLEDIQSLKTEIFELTVKIDELSKTRDLYTFKSKSKRNAFSPSFSDNDMSERNKIIDDNINQLSAQKDLYCQKLRNLDSNLKSMKKYLSHINAAKDAIVSLKETYSDDYNNPFEFIDNDSNSEPAENLNHGYNILMQQAFKDAYLNSVLEKEIKGTALSMNSKLNNASLLLRSDVTRARVTLKEISDDSNELIDSIEFLQEHTDAKYNTDKSFFTCIEDFIMQIREDHPECILDFQTNNLTEETKLHPVFFINTLKLINIFFNNIFKHANANKIEFSISIDDNLMLSIHLSDNGVGIDSEYMTKSPWYSSLHQAHEIVYLLGGKLDISGSLIGGTTIDFSYSIKNK